MQVKTLQQVSKIIAKISNPSSLTPLYKSLEVGPDSIRCCSEFGNFEIWLDPTGLTQPQLLNVNALIAVASSLPETGEIKFAEKDNKVNWSCGSAKGHWNLVQTDHQIPTLEHTNFPWEPPKYFPEALLLASSACQAAAVSVGLYGILLDQIDGRLRLFSSNSIALASAAVDANGYTGGKVTLRPPVPAIMAAIIQACPGCKMDITQDGIYMLGDWMAAHLPLGAELEHDLAGYASAYQSSKHAANIDSPSIKKFITRARALADKHSSFNIKLQVANGRLSLEHSGLASSTEEVFLADGLPTDVNYSSVALPADMLLLPLESVTSVVLDYLPDQRLVLKGTNPEFLYVVGGEN